MEAEGDRCPELNRATSIITKESPFPSAAGQLGTKRGKNSAPLAPNGDGHWRRVDFFSRVLTRRANSHWLAEGGALEASHQYSDNQWALRKDADISLCLWVLCG